MYYYFTTSLEMAIQCLAGAIPGFNVVRYGPNIPGSWEYEWKMRTAMKELKLKPRQKMNTLLARRYIYSQIDMVELPKFIADWQKQIKDIEDKIEEFSDFMDSVVTGVQITQPVLVSKGMKYFPHLKINNKMKIVDITSLILTGEFPKEEEEIPEDNEDVIVPEDPQITALYLSIAEICHTVNREYCIFIGDDSQPVWDEAPDNIKKSALSGVELFLKNPAMAPDEMHQKWVDYKLGEGWKYGEVKDVKEKLHPSLVRFTKLPEVEQFKDTLFIDTIKWSFTKLQEEEPIELDEIVKEMVEYMKLKAQPLGMLPVVEKTKEELKKDYPAGKPEGEGVVKIETDTLPTREEKVEPKPKEIPKPKAKAKPKAKTTPKKKTPKK